MATPSHQALGPDPGGRPDEPGTGDGRAARQRAPRAGGSLACDAAGRPRRGRLSRAHRGGPAAGLVGPPRSRAHGPVAIAVAVVVAVGDAVLRPALRLLVSRAGAVGALVLGILAQLLVVGGALSLTPGVQSGSVATVVPALLLVALFSTVGRFLLGTGDEAAPRPQRRRRRRADGPRRSRVCCRSAASGSWSSTTSRHGGRSTRWLERCGARRPAEAPALVGRSRT